MEADREMGSRSDVFRPRSGRLVQDTVGVLLAGGEGRRLLPLTAWRAKPAIPFAGEHCLIDFTLGNCLHSGLRRLIVVTRHKAYTVEAHLAALAPSLARRGLELEIHRLPADRHPGGTAGAVSAVLERVTAFHPRFVLVLAADHVYRMDYEAMLQLHASSGAMGTVASSEVELAAASAFGVMAIGPGERVRRFHEKPTSPASTGARSGKAAVSMGVYVFRPHELARVLRRDAEEPTSSHDLGTDIMPRMADSDRLVAYPFKLEAADRAGYWRDVGTLGAFYHTSMELIGSAGDWLVRDPDWPLPVSPVPGRTQMPSAAVDRRAQVESCLLPREITIPRCRMQRCVVSPGVVVGADAELEDSILLPGARVGREAKLRKCIVGPGVPVPAGAQVHPADPREAASHCAGVAVLMPGTAWGGLCGYDNRGRGAAVEPSRPSAA